MENPFVHVDMVQQPFVIDVVEEPFDVSV